MKVLSLVSVLLLVSCGQSNNGSEEFAGIPVTNPKVAVPEASTDGVLPAYSVTSSSALPKCTDSIVGQIIYTENDGKFQFCRNEAWSAIQEEETPSATPSSIVKARYKIGMNIEDSCYALSDLHDPFSQSCYVDRGFFVIFADDTVFFSINFEKYVIDDSVDRSSETISGFAKVEDNKIIADLDLFYGINSHEYVNHWLVVNLETEVTFLVEDENSNYHLDGTDLISAELNIYEQ